MGLDVSVNLLVGVRLLDLGELETTAKSIELTNKLGRKIGRSAVLQQECLKTPHGRFLLGSNEDSLSSDYSSDRIQYFYHELLGISEIDADEDLYYRWIHESDSGPDQVIVGQAVATIQGPYAGMSGYFKAAHESSIAEAIVETKRELQERFGYQGPVYVVAQAHYSY